MVKKIGLPPEHCWVVLLGGLVWRVSNACAVVFMNVVLGASIGLRRVFTFLVPWELLGMDVLSSADVKSSAEDVLVKPWECLQPNLVLGTKMRLSRVFTRGVPCQLLGMEVVLGTNIGLSRGNTYVLLVLYVLPGSDVDSSID